MESINQSRRGGAVASILTIAIIVSLSGCASDSDAEEVDSGQSQPSPVDSGHDASPVDNAQDAARASDAGAVDAASADAGRIERGRCHDPVLSCSRRDDGCPLYEPLTECRDPLPVQVREGFCAGLRLRVSFNGGGESIHYWDEETDELVAVEGGSDVLDFCDGTSSRIVEGDLERVEICEETRGPQHIICSGDDDAGVDYSGL